MRGSLRGDFFGGLTAAIIALPLGLAFGVASGLGAAAGLWGAIILGFFASFFGGTQTQISGPTGPMTVVVASSVITFDGNISLVASMVVLAGLFQILFGLARFGKFVQYIPYPVISGFMSGIGVIIIILQLAPLFGATLDASVAHALISLPTVIMQTNGQSLLLGSLTLMILYFTPQRFSKIIPSPLIALVALTLFSILAGFEVDTIGKIPAVFPSFVAPSFELSTYTTVITLALTLAMLGTIDTLLTSIVADSITRTKHNSNRELLGQGIGNMLCGLSGSVPGAGATMRTVVNIKSGGNSRYSGMIHALGLLLVVLLFAPLASKIPMAVLAGVLIKVGIDILDYKFLKVWRLSPKNDLAVMVIVFLVTVFVDLMVAVGVGVVMASLLVVYRITKETEVVLEGELSEENLALPEGTRIVKINGAFFFGSSTFFESKINSLLDTKRMIIDISSVPFIDITAIFTLKELIARLQKDGVKIAIIAKNQHKNKILKLNQDKTFDTIEFFKTVKQAILAP
ncbi:MAG TPA: SulP family inorganic anion transporter [Epsilonproteobacteria bacterium]|nr:SulP family inorganic anion transporter [Campylobacterota bacterium]